MEIVIRDFSQLKAAIDEIAPLITQHADAADEQRRPQREVATAMARAGLYRVAVPASLGGGEEHPELQIRTIEEVSRLDGGTGWALMIGIENLGILGPFLDRSLSEVMYADPELIMAGALNPMGQAHKVEGGYRVSGQWPFASGVHNAGYFMGQCIVHENGERLRDANGMAVLIEILVAASEFEIVDTWQVSGLRGSGSHDVRVDEVFVPESSTAQVAKGQHSETGTLFRFPMYSRLAYNKVGVATGIARAAIDHFVELASNKTPRAAATKLQQRPDAQHAIAEAEYLLGSSRSYVFAMVNELWDQVEAGERPDAKQRARMQLACSGACTSAVQAVEKVYAAAGASANFKANPLERCMRDVLVVRQHIMVSPQWHDVAGKVLLGLPSETFLF